MNYKIETSPLADYYVVAVKHKGTDELKEVFTVNEIGHDMLKLFCEGKDTEAVVEMMADIYNTSQNRVEADVMSFAEKLRMKGII